MRAQGRDVIIRNGRIIPRPKKSEEGNSTPPPPPPVGNRGREYPN